MNIKSVLAMGIVVTVASTMALDFCEVTGVKARQRYPWNGLVDIDFTLDSKATEPYLMNVFVYDNVGKTNLPVKTVYTEGISFEDNPCMVHKDTSRIIWNAAADLPDGFKCTNVLVTCQDVRSMGISNLYMIVDLSGGTSAARFQVSYTNCPPAGGWTEEHMTTKLVLRRVEPGAFLMGSAFAEEGHQANETLHRVTLTKPYYIGIYEVTEKQFALIYGGSGADTQPVKKDIGVVRGFDIVPDVTVEGSNVYKNDYGEEYPVNWKYAISIKEKNVSAYSWPSSTDVDGNSFMGKLRSKTGLNFDLPTEAQWENACRAGSALPLNNGEVNSSSGVSQIKGAAKLDPTETHYLYVGNYMPNALGLYDMQGGVDEWCLDAYRKDLGSSDVVDPNGGTPVVSSVKLLDSQSEALSGRAQYRVVFNGKTYFTYTNENGNQNDVLVVSYLGYNSTRVVRGGNVRAAYRTSATSMNTSGAIFTTGVLAVNVSNEKTALTKKAAFTNPTHGIRVALTVAE